MSALNENYRFRRLLAGILALVVILAAVIAYSGDDRLNSTWRGIVTGLLLLFYLGWIFVGWFDRFPMDGRRPTIRFISWFFALAIATGLVFINHDFILLLWILFGSTPFYLGKRLGLVPMVGVLVLIGLDLTNRLKLPRDFSEWRSFFSWLIGAAVWFLLILAIKRLLRQRAENEELIAELKSSQEQLRQAAAKERELLVLRERERLARDLHDIIGHALVLASVKLEAAQRLSRFDRERAATELTATQQLLRQTMTELRQAVTNLRTGPESGEAPISLTDQIRIMIDETGIPAVMTLEPITELNPIQAEAMRRIAQEALTNIVKHANATEISVSLRRQDEEIELEIADNGRGFGSAAVAATGHFGIRGMHERIALSGGELSVQSTPGTGTRVRTTLPLAPLNDRAPYAVPEVISGAA